MRDYKWDYNQRLGILDSINLKWIPITKFAGHSTHANSRCPLCTMHYDKGWCTRCPIKIITGARLCSNFVEYQNYITDPRGMRIIDGYIGHKQEQANKVVEKLKVILLKG